MASCAFLNHFVMWVSQITIDVENEDLRNDNDMKFKKLTDHLKLKADQLVGFKPQPYELSSGFGYATESIYKMVDQFHALFQHPRRVMPTPELLRLRAKLIHEEAVTEGIPAAENGDITALLDAMADFLYVGIGTMAAIKGGISTGMSYYTQEQSVDRFVETIFVPGNTVYDDMAIPFHEASCASQMLEKLADKLETTTLSDSELIRELRQVMNKLYVACLMTYRLAEVLGCGRELQIRPKRSGFPSCRRNGHDDRLPTVRWKNPQGANVQRR